MELLLDDDLAEAHDNAAKALRNLTSHADNRAKVTAVGAIPPLVALLRHRTGIQEHAVAALVNLACQGDIRPQISAAGAIPLLVALLGPHSSAGVTKLVFTVFWKLACNTDILAQMVAMDDICLLIALLGDLSSPSTQLAATGRLLQLASGADSQVSLHQCIPSCMVAG